MDIFELDKQYIAGTYKRFPVAIEHGMGSILYGYDGKEYIDMGSGIGVTAFGSCDSEWKEAVKDAGDVKFRFGIEAGFAPGACEGYIETFKKYPFDVVINSVHFVDHYDVYFLNPFIFRSNSVSIVVLLESGIIL